MKLEQKKFEKRTENRVISGTDTLTKKDMNMMKAFL